MGKTIVFLPIIIFFGIFFLLILGFLGKVGLFKEIRSPQKFPICCEPWIFMAIKILRLKTPQQELSS